MKLTLSETQKTSFLASGLVYFCCLIDSSRTNITSATDNTKEADTLTGIGGGAGHIIWLLRSTSSYTQVISKLQPTESGNGGDFVVLVAGHWYDTVLTAHLPGWGVVTNDWCALLISPLCTSNL